MPASTSSPTRDRIIRAAIRILGEEGAGAFTVRRVATEAGCSTIGVYTHFTDKTGLLEAVVLDGFEGFRAALAVADAEPNGRARLLASAGAYRRWAHDNVTSFLIMFTPLVPGFTLRPAITERTTAAYLDHRARVAHGVATGILRDEDVDELARHLWALVHGRVMLELGEGWARDNPEVEAGFARSVGWALDALAPPH